MCKCIQFSYFYKKAKIIINQSVKQTHMCYAELSFNLKKEKKNERKETILLC